MTAYPLRKWDKEIAPYLRPIADSSRWLSYHARNVTMALGMLPARPQWPTQAEEALEQAERELTAALDLTKQARRKYRELDVIPELIAAE